MKGAIAHSHDTTLPREDGEDVATSWGTRPSRKAKPIGEDPRDTLARGWGNRPNLEKDPTPTCGWGNRPNPKKDPNGIKVQAQ